MYKALINGTIFTGDDIITGKTVLIKDNLIAGITGIGSVPDSAEITDCLGMNIAPGLIDLQIAGSGGYLYSSGLSRQALFAIADSILASGTTSCLIVLPTNSPEVYREAIRIARENPHPAIMGLHLEGPFINPEKKGAHAGEFIVKPDRKKVDELLKDSGGIVRMITLAPELCSRDIIRQISDYGAVVCAGHSNATFTQAMDGFSRGVRAVTHIFNAMSQIHHRDPGLPGAVFSSADAMASIVADGIHVDYNMISIAKGILKERLYLVSDAVEESSEGACPHVRQPDRFTLPDGTLSGSALTMMKAVANCTENAGIPVDEALRMACTYPAKLMGLSDRGRIKAGYRADLIVFDNSYQPSIVIREGNIV